jgi:hypothetical protein
MSELHLIENYLLGELNPADKLLMEARLLISDELKNNMHWQQRVYQLIKLYGRNDLRIDIDAAHTQLFSEKRFESFRIKISRIFK